MPKDKVVEEKVANPFVAPVDPAVTDSEVKAPVMAPVGAEVVHAHHVHEDEKPTLAETVIEPRKPHDWEPPYIHIPASNVLYATVAPDPGTPLPVVEGAEPVVDAAPLDHSKRFMVTVGFENEDDANAFHDAVMKHAVPLVVAPEPEPEPVVEPKGE